MEQISLMEEVSAKKVWTKDSMLAWLKETPYAYEKAILKLYEKQTADEQQAQITKHYNGVGFNGTDSVILSSFANQLLTKPGYHLSPKQLVIAYKKVPKYAGQLAKIANGEI